MSNVLTADFEQREQDSRYVEFHANYEGPEYDAATEKLLIEVHDRRVPQGFGKPLTIHDRIPTQLINFVPFGPPGAFQRDFHTQRNRYFNRNTIVSAPITIIETLLSPEETARWEIRRIDFPVPLAHAYALVENSELMIAAVGSITDDLETILPTLIRLEPESADAAMLEAGKAALIQHRIKKARERQEKKESPDRP